MGILYRLHPQPAPNFNGLVIENFMSHTIGAIGDEAGNIASFVSWRATARGRVKRRRGIKP